MSLCKSNKDKNKFCNISLNWASHPDIIILWFSWHNNGMSFSYRRPWLLISYWVQECLYLSELLGKSGLLCLQPKILDVIHCWSCAITYVYQIPRSLNHHIFSHLFLVFSIVEIVTGNIFLVVWPMSNLFVLCYVWLMSDLFLFVSLLCIFSKEELCIFLIMLNYGQ